MKKKCQACGNNPVPHFLHWYYESLNVALAPLRNILLHNYFSEKAALFLSKYFSAVFLLSVLSSVKIIRFQDDKQLCKVPRAQVLWEEAEKRGIEMQELLLFGRPIDSYVAKINDRTLVFSGLPRPADYDRRGLEIMDDKYLFKLLLLKHNLPVAQGGSIFTYRQALTIFRSIQKPVIVKPRSGSRGRHSTIYVKTEGELKVAFKIAKQLCFWVIVEEQLFGPVYRGTVINYRTVGVLRGDSPQVTGDGKYNISQLVKMHNENKHPAIKDIQLGAAAAEFLSRQGKTFNTILDKGETVTLSEKIGVNYGGSSSEDLDICHLDNLLLFQEAARIVGDPVIGFDFIIPDITKSYKSQRCGFLEANSLPFINLHHQPLLGKPKNVASAIWDMICDR